MPENLLHVNKADISNLREMFSALGPLSKLFTTILNLIEKLIPPTASRKNHPNTETKTQPQSN
jgi:hypothetical protein